MSGPITRKEILQRIEDLRCQYEIWDKSPEAAPKALWRGQMVKALSEPVELAAISLFNLCASGDIERSAWPLVLLVDKYEAAFDKWEQDCKHAFDMTDPGGSAQMQSAWEEILRHRKPRTFPKPTPLAELMALKPPQSDNNICLEYGWIDPDDGRAQTEKIREELAKPGTHYNPDTWESKREKNYWADLAVEWQARCAKRGAEAPKRNRGVAPAPAPKTKRIAPETLEELVRLPGMTVSQAATMKGISEEEVLACARRMRVRMSGAMGGFAVGPEPIDDEEEIERRAEQIAQQSEAKRIRELNTYPGLGNDQEGRVMAMAGDNVRASDIARALSVEFPGITHNYVSAILKRAKQTAK